MSKRSFMQGDMILDSRDIHKALHTGLTLVPEGRSGNLEVRHSKRNVVSVYREPMTYKLGFDILIEHAPDGERFADGNKEVVWMSATPQETVDLLPVLRRFPNGGRILMSGLGLGVVPRLLDALGKSAGSFVAVEQSQDVIDLVWPHIVRPGYTIHHGDVEDQLSAIGGAFDLAILDTWPSGDYLFLPWVDKLSRMAGRLVVKRGEMWLWQYQFMKRRLRRDLRELYALVRPHSLSQEDLEGLDSRAPYFRPFITWLNEAHRPSLDVAMHIEDEIKAFRRGERKGLYHGTTHETLLEAEPCLA